MYDDIKTACLYVRYSSANQTEQSIEGQIRVCRDFCDRHGIRIVEIYADRATSASKDIEKRVNFLKMIKDSEKHNFEAVIVYKLDRFSRSRYDMANFKYRLRKNGVQLISATENISNDPEGIILESVLEGMAEFYSAELSQKINRGLRESAFKHNSLGGQIPLGYKTEGKKLVIDEETAPIIREAFSMYAEGHSVAEICRLFNAKGYKTSKGARFGKSSFSKIFRNERYIGVYQFHDYRAEDVIPAIIDKKTFDQVQARLKTNGKAPGRNKAQVVYWLEQFKQGDIDDDDFRRLLIDLFVHSVTVWDEEDDHFKITIGYNLTSLENKTYRLTKGGTSSDFALNPPVLESNPIIHGTLMFHTVLCAAEPLKRGRKPIIREF